VVLNETIGIAVMMAALRDISSAVRLQLGCSNMRSVLAQYRNDTEDLSNNPTSQVPKRRFMDVEIIIIRSLAGWSNILNYND
jgi:hypothetical protein